MVRWSGSLASHVRASLAGGASCGVRWRWSTGRSRAGWRALVWMVVSCASVTVVAAGEPTDQASTSREAREQAIRSIPFDRLEPSAREQLQSVIDRPTIYRRMPLKVISCDPDLYLFLIRHPEVIVSIWQVMGVTKVKLERSGEFTFHASDGAGTQATAKLLYGTRELHVIYAEGHYEGPLLRQRLTARCVLLLSSKYDAQADRTLISNRLDVFLRLDNTGVDLAARTLHPLFGKTADTNFLESTGFLGQVSVVAERNLDGLERLCEKLTAVEPPVRMEFLELATAAHQRAARVAVQPTGAAGGRITDGGETLPIAVSTSPAAPTSAPPAASVPALRKPAPRPPTSRLRR